MLLRICGDNATLMIEQLKIAEMLKRVHRSDKLKKTQKQSKQGQWQNRKISIV